MHRLVRSVFLTLAVLITIAPAKQGEKHQSGRNVGDFFVEIQPKLIAPGEVATIRWHIKNATRVVIEEARSSTGKLRKIGEFAGEGSMEVRPVEDMTYVLNCEGPTSYSCASVSIRVREKKKK